MRRLDRRATLGIVAILCGLVAAGVAFGPRDASAQSGPGNRTWVVVDGSSAGAQFQARPVVWFRSNPRLLSGFDGEVLLAPAIGTRTGWALIDRRGNQTLVASLASLPGWQQTGSAAVMELLGADTARAQNTALERAGSTLVETRRLAAMAMEAEDPGAPPEGVLHTLDAAAVAVDEALHSASGARTPEIHRALDRTREALTELPRRPPPPAPVVTVAPSLLSFQDVCIGQSTQLSFIVSTTCLCVVRLFSCSVVCVVGAYVLLQAIPSSLAPGATVTINVIFKPSQEGDAHGKVSIKDSTSDDAETVSLGGTGEAMFALQPNVLDFGSVPVGQTKDLTFNIVSCTDKTVNLKVSTPTAGEFKIVVPPGAPATLEPHKSAPVTLRFEPTAPGKQYGAQVKVVGTADGIKGKHRRFEVPFGKSPLEIGIEPGKVSFGTVPLNTPKSVTFTLTNNTTQVQTVHFNTSGIDGTFFHFSETGPFTLAPGESHPITVTFEATGKCNHNDTLVLTGDGFTKEKIPITAVSQ